MALLIEFGRVVELNTRILESGPGLKGPVDIGKLEGALGRIEHAIWYQELDDAFEIAAKYVASIAHAHSMSDANKRTALLVGL